MGNNVPIWSHVWVLIAHNIETKTLQKLCIGRHMRRICLQSFTLSCLEMSSFKVFASNYRPPCDLNSHSIVNNVQN